MIEDVLIGPFTDYPALRRALVGSIAIAMSAAPIGVFLTLRRMSMSGDAIAHGILPGVAIGFLVAGFSLPALTIGGLIAGLAVALAAAVVSRTTVQREDASLAAFYLISLALGVALISIRGESVDIEELLFGSVPGLDSEAVIVLVTISVATLLGFAVIFRPLLMESFDPGFVRRVSGAGSVTHFAFLALTVLNLVAGFHALGTLMAVGIMILPAAASRFWARSVGGMIAIAIAIGIGSSVIGLLISYHQDVPTGPAIILSAGAAYILSLAAALWRGAHRQSTRG